MTTSPRAKRALWAVPLALALAGAGYLALPSPALPPDLVPPAGRYDARILRDVWGVPHVFGRTDADAAYGLAYAHAEDDFETIQGSLLAARGELAAEFGREAAANDYMVRLLGVSETVAAGYPRLPADVRALVEGYADGLNHYAALHPEAALPRLYPVRGQDVVAGFVHKLPLFFGLGEVLEELFAEPDAEGDAPDAPPPGSNAFAVAPGRSTDRSTMLLVNSHQPWDGPVAWYEAHVHSEEGWDMVGGLFPGAPLILHGHNRHLGWAHTVNDPDLIDLYRLEIDPDDEDRYRFDGRWRELEERQAPIAVRLFGKLRWTFERPVLRSIHGPAARRPDGTYALRYAGFDEVRQVEQWYRMNKARDFDEWRQAMALGAIPMFNTVYADREGRIFYVYNGSLPRRSEGWDWSGAVPGDRSETLWTETLPFDQLPQVLDPPSGFVQSCNSTPFRTTAGDGNPDPADFPPSLGIETEMTDRARRALALLGGDRPITRADFVAYKFDTRYSEDSTMAALVKRALDAPPVDAADAEVAEALEVLARWDLDTAASSRQAALAVLAFGDSVGSGRVDAAEIDSLTAADLHADLAAAARALNETFGRLEVPWGHVQRLRRGDVDLPLDGAPDVLRAIYSTPAEDGRVIGAGGDSYLLIAAWDESGEVRSRSIHPYGSATSRPESPHYADQSKLFASRRFKPVWMDEGAIRAQLEREYRPGEEARSSPAEEESGPES